MADAEHREEVALDIADKLATSYKPPCVYMKLLIGIAAVCFIPGTLGWLNLRDRLTRIEAGGENRSAQITEIRVSVQKLIDMHVHADKQAMNDTHRFDFTP